MSVLCLPFALFSVTALVMCLALAVVAYNEFRGRKLLDGFEPSGPRTLGWNQLLLMGVLIGYSVWNIYLAETGPSPYAEQVEATPELGSMLGSIDDLYKTVTLTVYGSLIAASLIFQGLNALYYFSRQKHLQSFLDAPGRSARRRRASAPRTRNPTCREGPGPRTCPPW